MYIKSPANHGQASNSAKTSTICRKVNPHESGIRDDGEERTLKDTLPCLLRITDYRVPGVVVVEWMDMCTICTFYMYSDPDKLIPQPLTCSTLPAASRVHVYSAHLFPLPLLPMVYPRATFLNPRTIGIKATANYAPRPTNQPVVPCPTLGSTISISSSPSMHTYIHACMHAKMETGNQYYCNGKHITPVREVIAGSRDTMASWA